MHDTEEASKIWMVEVPTIEYSDQSEELMYLLSVTLYLIKRFTKRRLPQGGVYGGLVILAQPGPMVREGTLYITTPPEVSDPSSSQSSQLISVVFKNKHVEPKYDTYH